MLKRNIEAELFQTAEEYPVITITGPRQSGKTTLAKICFPEYRYVNLENPELRTLALNDPKSFLKMYPTPVVIDEIQNVPELLSWIQVATDDSPRLKAQFILTGSHQLKLREAISQSLAGRISMLTLLPFSFSELGPAYMQKDRSELLLRGGMPRLNDQNIRSGRFYRDYFQTYIERDPVFGSLFENMIIVDIYKERLNKGSDPNLYFFRDHHGNEVDLFIPGVSYTPVEIKSARTFKEDFIRGIRYFRKLSDSQGAGLLLYDGDLDFETDNVKVRNFRKQAPGIYFQ